MLIQSLELWIRTNILKKYIENEAASVALKGPITLSPS